MKIISRFLLSFIILLLCQLIVGAQITPPIKQKQQAAEKREAYKKATEQRFFKHKGKYTGAINGDEAELVLDILKGEDNASLTFIYLSLSYKQNGEKYWGILPMPDKVGPIEDIQLTNAAEGRPFTIDKLFLHQHNVEYISLLVNGCMPGNFFKKPENIHKAPKTPFQNNDDILGYYKGVLDGKDVALHIQKRGAGYLILFTDLSTKDTFGQHYYKLPLGRCANSLINVELFNPEWTKSIKFPVLAWHKNEKQLISGYTLQDGNAYGVSFFGGFGLIIKPLSANMDEFIIPGLPSSKIIANIPPAYKKLGQVDAYLTELISNGLYPGCQRYFNISPGNGFAIVTPMERINCDAIPIQPEDERWRVGIDEAAFGFSDLVDLFLFAPPDYYRTFIFTVTDQNINTAGQSTSFEEMMELLNSERGSLKLPETLAEKQFTSSHKVTLYVYQFQKKTGGRQINMVEQYKNNDCWHNARVHLINTELERLIE